MSNFNFKQWYLESISVKSRLVVYDFDSTLVNVPERPKNWDGKDWWGSPDSLSAPHFDPNHANHDVLAAFRRDQSDPNTEVILLTGRRGVISSKVREVLRFHGLNGRRVIPDSNKNALQKFSNAVDNGDDIHHNNHGHEEYYSGDHSTEEDYPKGPKGKPDGSTSVFKAYIVNKKVGPEKQVIEFWDDRADHVPLWMKLGIDFLKKYGVDQGGKLQHVVLHRVFPPAYPGVQATIQHVPINVNMNY